MFLTSAHTHTQRTVLLGYCDSDLFSLFKASVSKPPVSQRCQLVKTLSKARPIRLKSSSKPTPPADKWNSVYTWCRTIGPRGTTVGWCRRHRLFFWGINKAEWSKKKEKGRLIGTWLKTMATDSLVNSLWKPSRKPGGWVKTALR